MTTEKPAVTVRLEGLAASTFASRKFLVALVIFAASLALAFFRPEFVGDGQTLFNFWIFLIGLYFGGNIAEHVVNGKGKGKV